jgi:hypothetical protein
MINEELMPFKKFVQGKRELYEEETILINGTFKESDRSVHTGDIFNAHLLGRRTIEEIYKLYLEWFNYTKKEGELERSFVSVKLAETKKEKQ